MRKQEIINKWKEIIIGQDHAVDKISPYVARALASLNAPGRPLGVFFLMGPSGTGKTRTAETLAHVLHGNEKNILRVDCGEFQSEHEVAKLIGSPPGYLGHRETIPVFHPSKLMNLQSEKVPISIILMDEVEKAHPAMWRILLGILDKAELRIGDNTVVDFSRCFIFMTSNVGAREMQERLSPCFGFSGNDKMRPEEQLRELEKIGFGAMSRKFPPEFSNRIDETIVYSPLSKESLEKITRIEMGKLRGILSSRLIWYNLNCGTDTIEFLTRIGTSQTSGARGLRRTLARNILDPLADYILEGKVYTGSNITCKVVNGAIEWDINNDNVVLPNREKTKRKKTKQSVAVSSD